MEEPEGTINEPERINFSAVEGVAYHLGTLKICSEIERNFLDGDWEAEGRQWSGVRKALLALVEFLNLDESLKSFAPKDPFVENGIRERSKSDPRCFNTTADWLFRLRKDRGTVIQLEDIDLPDIDGHAHFSTLENLARVYGMIDILQANEQFVRACQKFCVWGIT